MKSLRIRLCTQGAALAAILLSALFSVKASAQKSSPPPNQPAYSGSGSAAGAIDDTTLKQTARAYVKVREIVRDGQRELNGTNDDTQKRRIVAEVESNKLAAVKAAGLQPEQYNQVIQLAQTDKALRDKLLSYVRQVKGAPGGNE